MNRTLLLALTLLTASCAQTEVVKVPIVQPCPTPIPAQPSYTFEQLSKEDSIYTKVQHLLSDRELSKAYEIELETALKSCK